MPRRSLSTRVVAIIAATALAVGAVGAVGVFGPQPKPTIQGDQLGPERDEPLADYQARAAATLDGLGDEPTHALVSFERGLSPTEAATAVGDVDRVSAVIIGQAAPIPVPEPVDGADRAEVFDTVLHRVAQSLEGVGDVRAPRTLNAVVVYDNADTLRNLATHADVLAVEAVPADAAWGAFAIRPPDYHGQS